MHDHNLNLLYSEIEGFLDFLKLKTKLNLVFVENRYVDRCLVNDCYPNGDILYINVFFLKKIDLDYAMILVKNEIYCFTQGITNEVKEIKEKRYRNLWDYLDVVSQIETDLKVVSYLKEKNETFSFLDYARLYYKGHSVPNFDVLRINAFEHFMGSMISINIYLTEQKTKYIVPRICIDQLAIADVDFDKRHLGCSIIAINPCEIIKWKSMVQNANNLDEDNYIGLLNELTKNIIVKLSF